MAVVHTIVVEGCLHLNSMRWVKVTKRVLGILDLFEQASGVDALVSNCVKATDVSSPVCIVVTALDELEFVVVRHRWGQEWRLQWLVSATRVIA